MNKDRRYHHYTCTNDYCEGCRLEDGDKVMTDTSSADVEEAVDKIMQIMYLHAQWYISPNPKSLTKAEAKQQLKTLIQEQSRAAELRGRIEELKRSKRGEISQRTLRAVNVRLAALRTEQGKTDA